MAPAIGTAQLGNREGTDMMVIAPLACFCLMVLGVILYQIDARAAGGFLHPSSALMAKLMLWRWGGRVSDRGCAWLGADGLCPSDAAAAASLVV